VNLGQKATGIDGFAMSRGAILEIQIDKLQSFKSQFSDMG
jgi:hypothetical protein